MCRVRGVVSVCDALSEALAAEWMCRRILRSCWLWRSSTVRVHEGMGPGATVEEPYRAG